MDASIASQAYPNQNYVFFNVNNSSPTNVQASTKVFLTYLGETLQAIDLFRSFLFF